MSTPYRKVTVYVFEVDRYVWEITKFTEDRITFGESRKAGREDINFGSFEVVLVDGYWRLDGETLHRIRRFYGGVTEQALEAFFNEHGPPTETAA